MKRRYHIGIVLMMLSAMLTLNVYKVSVWAVDKKQQVQNENKKLQEKNKKIQNEIKELDEKMTASHETYEKYRSKLSSVQKELKDTQERLQEAKQSKEEQSRIMSKRIKFLYENGNMAYMEVIFEASNFQEFLRRADYVSKVSKYDSKDVNSAAKSKEREVRSGRCEETREDCMVSEEASIKQCIACCI